MLLTVDWFHCFLSSSFDCKEIVMASFDLRLTTILYFLCCDLLLSLLLPLLSWVFTGLPIAGDGDWWIQIDGLHFYSFLAQILTPFNALWLIVSRHGVFPWSNKWFAIDLANFLFPLALLLQRIVFGICRLFDCSGRRCIDITVLLFVQFRCANLYSFADFLIASLYNVAHSAAVIWFSLHLSHLSIFIVYFTMDLATCVVLLLLQLLLCLTSNMQSIGRLHNSMIPEWLGVVFDFSQALHNRFRVSLTIPIQVASSTAARLHTTINHL